MIDAPRNSDGKHAPETPKTNARRPASIFHFNSHMGDAGATPESSLQCLTTQTSAVRYTAAI